ncbi:MAG: PQQ-binding-like beta-propeller repeat protein [Polyangia bacterium]
MFTKHWLLCGALLAGCGPAAFSAHSRDNNVGDVQKALSISKAPARGPRNGTGKPMAFAVTAGPDKMVVGIDLASRGVVWKFPADVRSRIVVGKGLVAYRLGDHELVGRDPASGRELFKVSLPANEQFMGMAIDDDHLYYVVQSTGESKRVSYTVGLDHSGHEAWRTPAPGTLGAPAARGGLVAVPFAYQNLVLLDGASGKEVGRVRNTDEQVTFVVGLPDGFFYGGGKGIYLLDDKSASGTRAGSSYAEVKMTSGQMRPTYWFDGYQPTQSDYSAFDRNRLLWRGVKSAGGVGFESDLAVLHSFRYLFGIDTKSGALRWAYANPRTDVVGTEDVGDAIAYATADGEIGALDEATGQSHPLATTGLRIAGVTIDADGIVVPQGSADSAPAALRASLEQIVWDPDARFTVIKIFATEALGRLPGLDTTEALLKIVRAPTGVPVQVQRRAGEALVARKDAGAVKLYADALATHSDFLTDKHAVGVDIIARAAAGIDAKSLAPAIASHLADPETPQPSLKDLVVALGTLGGKDASRALRTFLLTYRADPIFLQDPSPLVAAGNALLTMGPEERRSVSFVAEERRTLPPVAESLKAALAVPAKGAPRATKKQP